jgi:hypothetical protein
MKSSCVIIGVDVTTLMMEAETVSETLDCNAVLTRLIAREDFIAFSRRESFKYYIISNVFVNGLCIIIGLHCLTFICVNSLIVS